MSTTSPNFGLVISTNSDVVNVTSQIGNNFSTLDSILGVSHTGSGQLKNSLAITTPTLISPTVSGNLSGAEVISASTGSFSTITATGGIITVSALSAGAIQVGTYTMPTAIGATGALLTVQTGNAQWVSPSGGTGANTGLSNLASVAINTSLNNFSAGTVTVNSVTGTAGKLTGMTTVQSSVVQATTGTFTANLVVTGTLTAGIVNCTGGAITAGGFSVGTYSYPTTVGSTGQILTVTTGNAVWVNPQPIYAMYTANGTYVATSNQMVLLTMIGGGGGGSDYNDNSHGGGASAGYVDNMIITLSSGQVYTITVGASGTGAGVYAGPGGNGGSSSITGAGFPSLVYVGGGQGGNSSTAAAGVTLTPTMTNPCLGGVGAGSICVASGSPFWTGASSHFGTYGAPASGYGAGGNAARGGGAGNGSPGFVRIFN